MHILPRRIIFGRNSLSSCRRRSWIVWPLHDYSTVHRTHSQTAKTKKRLVVDGNSLCTRRKIKCKNVKTRSCMTVDTDAARDNSCDIYRRSIIYYPWRNNFPLTNIHFVISIFIIFRLRTESVSSSSLDSLWWPEIYMI